MTIEGDYTLFAHLETVVPRRARAADADHDERRAACSRPRAASRSSSCPRATTITASRPATATRRYVAGQIVGAPIGVTTDAQASWWGGSGVGTVPHCADRRVRRQHGARGDEVRGLGAGRTSTSPCSSTSRTTRSRRRSRSRARSGRGSGACGSTRRRTLVDRSLWNEMGDFRPDRGQRAARAQGARRARRGRLRAREDRRFGRIHGREDRGRSSRRACRSTRTASARR